MAKFPVEISDSEGIVDAVNNLLSGPAGLGQNFEGFSANGQNWYWLTGNYRPPFTSPAEYTIGPGTPPYVDYTDVYYLNMPATIAGAAPIDLSTAEMLDGRTYKFTFTTPILDPYGYPVFKPGNIISVSGCVDSFYDGDYSPIGVVECTDTYVIARTGTESAIQAPTTGGTVSISWTKQIAPPSDPFLPNFYNPVPISDTWLISTDCNAKATVTSETDRVFVSAQLNFVPIYWVNSAYEFDPITQFAIYIAINRYRGVPAYDANNPDYRFIFEETIAEDIIYTDAQSPGYQEPNPFKEVFTSIIDSPGPGYYWYILEMSFVDFSDPDTYPLGRVQVLACTLGLRSLAAQVVKQ